MTTRKDEANKTVSPPKEIKSISKSKTTVVAKKAQKPVPAAQAP